MTNSNNKEKGCEHDYKNYIRRGRANLRCPKCDKDITIELVLMADLRDKDKLNTIDK